jgi:hypothetical protein
MLPKISGLPGEVTPREAKVVEVAGGEYVEVDGELIPVDAYLSLFHQAQDHDAQEAQYEADVDRVINHAVATGVDPISALMEAATRSEYEEMINEMISDGGGAGANEEIEDPVGNNNGDAVFAKIVEIPAEDDGEMQKAYLTYQQLVLQHPQYEVLNARYGEEAACSFLMIEALVDSLYHTPLMGQLAEKVFSCVAKDRQVDLLRSMFNDLNDQQQAQIQTSGL